MNVNHDVPKICGEQNEWDTNTLIWIAVVNEEYIVCAAVWPLRLKQFQITEKSSQ